MTFKETLNDLSISIDSDFVIGCLESDISSMLCVEYDISDEISALEETLGLSTYVNPNNTYMSQEKKAQKSKGEFIRKLKTLIQRIVDLTRRVYTSITKMLRDATITINEAITKGLIRKDIEIPGKLHYKLMQIGKIRKNVEDDYKDIFDYANKCTNTIKVDNDGRTGVYADIFSAARPYFNQQSLGSKTEAFINSLDKKEFNNTTVLTKQEAKSSIKECADFIRFANNKIKEFDDKYMKILDLYSKSEYDNGRSYINLAATAFHKVVNASTKAIQDMMKAIQSYAIRAKKREDAESEQASEALIAYENLFTAMEAGSIEIHKHLKKYFNSTTSDAKELAKSIQFIKNAVDENRTRDAIRLSKSAIEKIDAFLSDFNRLNKMDFKKFTESGILVILKYVIPVSILISYIWTLKSIFDQNKWVKAVDVTHKKAQEIQRQFENPNDSYNDPNFQRYVYANKVAYGNALDLTEKANKKVKDHNAFAAFGIGTEIVGSLPAGYITKIRNILNTTIQNLELSKNKLNSLIDELEQNGCSSKAKSIIRGTKVKTLAQV